MSKSSNSKKMSKKILKTPVVEAQLYEEWENYSQPVRESRTKSSSRKSCFDHLKHRSWDEAYEAINVKSAMETDSHDRSLLHIAAASDSPAAIIERLIQLNPSALSLTDQFGKLPLHYSAEFGTSTYILEMIHVNYTSASSIQDRDGHCPLHSAIKQNAPTDSIIYLLSLDDSPVRIADRHDNLPLHLAAESCISPDGAATILRAYPGAAEVKNCLGLTPLLCAAANGNDRILKLLIFNDSDSVYIKDNSGRAPLHLAVKCPGVAGSSSQTVRSSGNVLETVTLLLSTDLNSLLEEDQHGNTPFHACCQGGHVAEEVTLQVLQLLLDAEQRLLSTGTKTSSLIKRKNAKGQLPLHIAAMNCGKDVMLALLGTWPNSIGVRDGNDYRPIHAAALSPNSIPSGVAVLVEADRVLVAGVGVDDTENGGSVAECGDAGHGIDESSSTIRAPREKRRFSLEGMQNAHVQNSTVHARHAFNLSGEMQTSKGTLHSASLYNEYETAAVSLAEVSHLNNLHRFGEEKRSVASSLVIKPRTLVIVDNVDDADNYPPPPPKTKR